MLLAALLGLALLPGPAIGAAPGPVVVAAAPGPAVVAAAPGPAVVAAAPGPLVVAAATGPAVVAAAPGPLVVAAATGPAVVAAATGPAVVAAAPGPLVVAAATGPAVVAVAGPGPGATATGSVSGTIEWRPCAQDATADCGTLALPIDWADPSGARFDLAVARRRAADPAARIGSLVVHPGGPGGSGVDFAVLGARHFSDEITSRFDIVGFDPRGVGRSSPVRCSLELVAQAPPGEPTSQADLDRVADHNRRLAADCRERTGPIFDHVDTGSVVRDLDAIRGALGDRELTFYGASYGTLLGQRYAEAYPGRVRALALDGVMDHRLGTGDFLRTQAAAAQDSFDEFVRACTADTRCALHGRDIRALWADLLARAGRGELADPYDPSHALTPSDLAVLAFSGFYAPDWFGLADHLATLDAPPAPGRRTAAGPRAPAPAYSPIPAYGAIAGRTRGDEPRSAAVVHPFPAVFCRDWAVPVRDFQEYDRYARQAADLAPDLKNSPLGLAAVTSCLGWPVPVTNPPEHPPARVDAPLLLLNSLHDPATGYAWADAVARRLGAGAALVTYDGWGHGVYGRGACVTAAVDRYLISRELPAPGARCPALAPEPAGIGVRATIQSLPPGPAATVPGWG